MSSDSEENETNYIVILHEGYSREEKCEGKTVMRANCTCTLIKGKNNYNVIVDTMTAWDKDVILEALSKEKLEPKDINAVICTHGHSDHIGNNNLFLNAEWHIVGESISNHDKYISHDFKVGKFHLNDDITIIATPGHTLTCITVLVEDTNLAPLVGICGDLFEKEEDINDQKIWLITAGCENEYMQRENRAKIAEMVDFIIPGHGKGFEVSPKYRDCLRIQAGLSEKDIERLLR